MTVEDQNAPTGDSAPMSGETITTELPSIDPNAAPEAPEPEAETVAEQTAEPKAEGETPAPDVKKPPLTWQEKRRIEETNKRREAETELAKARKELAELRQSQTRPSADPAAAPASDQTITPEQARTQARLELEQEARQREFSNATGRVLQAGIESIPDFEQARDEMVANFGAELNARPEFFEAIIDPAIPNGHDVFYALAKDPEQTERLLSLPPVRLAVEIAKLSDKLARPSAPAPRPISKAPAPIVPVGGAAQTGIRLDDPNADMDAWAKTYLKTVASKGR